jgi:hypothetical protein
METRTLRQLPYRFTLVLAFAITFSSPSAAQDRIEHQAAGIAIDRPVGWHDVTLAQVQANRERARLADPELQHAMSTRSALPILAFTKYEEPHAGLNPTIQVALRPAISGTPTQLLAVALETVRRAFADFRLVAPPKAVQVAGWPAAHASATYTLHNEHGEVFRVKSRFWLVPRGTLMFLIGMSGSQIGDDECEPEFTAVISTLTINP